MAMDYVLPCFPFSNLTDWSTVLARNPAAGKGVSPAPAAAPFRGWHRGGKWV